MVVTRPLRPLEALYDAPELSSSALTPTLEALYGGGLALEEPRVYANFVSTLDGVVAIPALAQSNQLISDGSEGDRFVMGLLRAFADVVLIGAGTLAGSPCGTWTPERAYPAAAADYAELRSALGKPERPALAILTGSGSVDPAHPAIELGAVVLTSDRGAARLRGRLPAASTVVLLGRGPALDPHGVIGALRERGHGLIVSEAGPRGFGALVQAGLVDELFVTLSPLLAGSTGRGDRLSLIEGADLLPTLLVRSRLLSLRRESEHLFARYALDAPVPAQTLAA
jgi:riboflavin biosynthesis pyrimidine reductase